MLWGRCIFGVPFITQRHKFAERRIALKKALIIFASPHKNGPTNKLLQSFLSGLDQTAWETEIVDVCKNPVKPCIACGACKAKDGCVYADMDAFDASFRASDLLVIAAPVYNLGFPAQMKALLDRFQRYFEARFTRGVCPVFEKRRRAVLLLTMGQDDGFAIEVCEKTLKQSFSILSTKLTDTFCLMNTDEGVPEDAPDFEKARIKAIEINCEL